LTYSIGSGMESHYRHRSVRWTPVSILNSI